MIKGADLYIAIKNFKLYIYTGDFLKVSFTFDYKVMSLWWHLHVHV